MYQIYYAKLGKALAPQVKTRPVVVVHDYGDKVGIYKVTGRYCTDEPYYVHMNSFKIYGYCNVKMYHVIDKKYLLSYVRACTTEEEQEIKDKRNLYLTDEDYSTESEKQMEA